MVVAELTLFPIGQGESLSRFVARVTRVIRRSGLPSQLTPMGTVVEGPLDSILRLVRACVRELQGDCPRLSLSLRADIRRGTRPRMARKVDVVERLVRARSKSLTRRARSS